MASFAPIKDTRAAINATPIVDGQLLFETDMGFQNRIYLDDGASRVTIGGNGVNYLYELADAQISNEEDKQILQYNGTSAKWENSNGLDEWYSEIKNVNAGTTSTTFTISKTITEAVAFDPYCEVNKDAPLPTIESVVISDNSLDNTKDDIIITFTEPITSAQAGGGNNKCKIKLRMIK